MHLVADARTDEHLLVAARRDPDAFSAFYRRYAGPVSAYFLRRTGQPELAADLTAETFAAVLHRIRRFDPARGRAVAWLFGIAHREWARALERGAVEHRARRRLRMEPIELDDEALERVEAVAASEAASRALAAAMAALPADQRQAIEARVLDEREYAEIAARVRTSEAVVRKRVSRGLAHLRSRLIEEELR